MGLKLRPQGNHGAAGWAKLDWKTRLHFFEKGSCQSLCGVVWYGQEYCTDFYTETIRVNKRRCCKRCLAQKKEVD